MVITIIKKWKEVFVIAGLITHYICGEVCLKTLENSHVKNLISKNRQIYNIGTQGPDIFFYYLPCLYVKKWYRLGNVLHKTKIQSFFSSMLDYIKELDSAEKDILVAYLSGYLTHYSLDCHTHPYIYYRSGFKVEGDKGMKIKHSVNHRSFETSIDVLMLKLISSEKPSDKKIHNLIKASKNETMSTAKILSNVLRDVYNVDMTDKHIYRAIYSMVAVNKVLQSKKGKRKYLMEFVENFTVGENILSCMIHDQDVKGDIDFLNLKKSRWYLPWDNEKEHELTFTDMFNDAVLKANEMIQGVHNFLNEDISKEELLNIIGNNSLNTGLDWDMPLDFKFCDVVFK